MQRHLILSLMVCATLAPLARAQTQGSDPVVVGALYNLTGFQSALDVPSLRGAELAVSEINREGGVLGRPLRLVNADGESRPDVLGAKTGELIAGHPSVSALIGLSDTDMVLGAAPVAAASGRLFLTSGATSPRLPAQVPKYLFLACFGDNVQAAAGAQWAYRTRSARTATILYQASSTYARLLQGYFRAAFEALGGRIVTARGFTTHDELRAAVRGIGKPDLVYLSTGDPDDIVKGVQGIRGTGFSGPILGGDGLDSEGLWQQHPEIDGVFFSTHAYLGEDNRDPRTMAFREAYARAYGEAPDAFSALGYDTVRLLAAAIARAKSTAPDAVLRALAAVDRFEGVTGVIGYAPGTRVPNKSVSILEVARGHRSLAQQLMPADVPPP